MLQRRLSPAVSREESKRVLRDRRLWSFLQTRGVTGGGEGVAVVTPRVFACNQRVTCWLGRRFTLFCRKTPAGFGVDVYRKSTGDLVLGKSAAKNSRCADRHDDVVTRIVLRHRVENRITSNSSRSRFRSQTRRGARPYGLKQGGKGTPAAQAPSVLKRLPG